MPTVWALSSRGSRDHAQIQGGRRRPLSFRISKVHLRVPSPHQLRGSRQRDPWELSLPAFCGCDRDPWLAPRPL